MGKRSLSRYVLDVASALVRINTENPPGRELEAARFFAEQARELGIRSLVEELDETRGSTIAVLDGGKEGATLMLNSHLDTVPVGDLRDWRVHPLQGIVRDGVLHGRGSADAKGCLAAMLGTLKLLVEGGTRINGRLIVAAVADEERFGAGTIQVVKAGYGADYVVVGEPTGMKICVGNRGRVEFVVRIKGRSVHASIPRKGVNAITVGAEIAREIARLETGYGKKHPVLGSNNASATMINGGFRSNIIPDSCTLTVDWRTVPGEDLQSATKRMKSLVAGVTKKFGRVSSDIKVALHTPAVATSSSSRLVRAAREAVLNMGRRASLSPFRATTDLGRIVELTGAEGIIFGPGNLTVAHTVRESVSVREIAAAAHIYAGIAKKMLGGDSS